MKENIPLELRERNQWVCWRYEVSVSGKPTKVPYNPRTMQHANVTDPNTWTDFRTAANAPNFAGIGFVLTTGDPYCIIDLDDKIEKPLTPEQAQVHAKILAGFPTYTERSPSGRGYHIVMRGKVPLGLKRDNVEVYSQLRYIAFTGDVVNPFPIVDCQATLEVMVGQMQPRPDVPELEKVAAIQRDAELFEMAIEAENGGKFNDLTRYDYSQLQSAGYSYPSHSEADQALLSMLCFYSRDNEQVKRIFRCSPLGRRDKATINDNYLDRTIRNLRRNEVSSADMEQAAANADAIRAAWEAQQAPQPGPDVAVTVNPGDWAAPPAPTVYASPSAPQDVPAPPVPVAQYINDGMPPGLVGDIGRYFHQTSIRPAFEISLCAALGFFAGVVGRQYNISDTGLNHYILVIAKTGTGKESANSSINKLVTTLAQQIPSAQEFIGPATFASGQGLIRTLDSQKCFVSILGEFGHTLQSINDPRASTATLMLKRALLDLYGKSGWGNVLRSTAYSDVEKNTKIVHAPAFTLLGESTPESFYDAIDGADIADGLIPRMHVVECLANRPRRNRAANVVPSVDLVRRVGDVMQQSILMHNNNQCCAIAIAPDALQILDTFDEQCDDKIRSAFGQGEAQLWNRAHLKALKLAGLLAVGINLHAPTVTLDLAQWAIEFTKDKTQKMVDRFFAGNVGTGDAKQIAEIKRVTKEYFQHNKAELQKYKCDPTLQTAGLVPYLYYWVRCAQLSAFYRDPRGTARCLQSALETLVHSESLNLVDASTAFNKFGKRQRLYSIAVSF